MSTVNEHILIMNRQQGLENNIIVLVQWHNVNTSHPYH